MAAEAGISYCAVALVTDYDCWRETGEAVDVASVLACLKKNIDNVQKVFVEAVKSLANNRQWDDVIKANRVRRSEIYFFSI